MSSSSAAGTWRKRWPARLRKSGLELDADLRPERRTGPHHRGAHGYRLGDASGMLAQDADIYLIAVSDKAVEASPRRFPSPRAPPSPTRPEACRWPPSRRNSPAGRLFYPMQTFTKGREVDFSVIPVFLETPSAELRPELEAFARQLSGSVIWATSEQRARCTSRRFSPATSPTTCMPSANASCATQGLISTC